MHNLPRHATRRCAFTLIELLVVIGIIAILVGLLVVSLSSSRAAAKRVQCLTLLHQQGVSISAYAVDNKDTLFWRSANLGIDGMDWYVWGGRETGNPYMRQANLMNRIIPRPLNAYADDNIEAFHCPADVEWREWLDPANPLGSHFDGVGNSYNFNSNGEPLNQDDKLHGLAGVRTSRIRKPAHTVVFMDASLYKSFWYGTGTIWHGEDKGNIIYGDGHGEYTGLYATTTGQTHEWNP